MAVHAEHLYVALRCSFSATASERTEAEAYLGIVVSDQAELTIRQSAAIHMKNQVRKYWTDDAWSAACAEEKAQLRQGILEVAVQVCEHAGLRKQIEEMTRLLILDDFPHAMPNLVTHLLQLLHSGDRKQTYCALVALRKLTGKYAMKLKDDLEAINAVVEQTFPTVLRVGQELLRSEFNPDHLEMAKLCLKSYFSATQMHIPPSCLEAGSLTPWMEFAMAVVTHPVPAEQIPPTEEGRNEFPPFKAKKWALQVLHRFFARWGNPALVQLDMKAFAKQWQDTYALPVSSSCMQLMGAWKQGTAVVTKRVLNLCLMCVAEGIQHASLYAHVKAHIAELAEFCFNVLQWQPEDEEQWQRDADEFLRERSDCIKTFNHPRSSAHELLDSLVKYRANTLQPILGFCQTHLDRYALQPTRETAVAKYGALAVVECVSGRLLSKKSKKKAPPVAAMLARYVYPDLASPFPHLRYRACATIEAFGERVEGDLRPALAGLVERLADPELPVRVQAGVSLRVLVDREELCDDIERQIPTILQRLLVVMSQTENEQLAVTMERIVTEFSDQIVPFASQLVQQLCIQFLRLSEDEDDEEASLARWRRSRPSSASR